VEWIGRQLAGAGSGVWSEAGPDQRDRGCGQEGRHGPVEDAPGAWCPEEALERGAGRQPGQAAGEGNQRKQDRENDSLGQGTAGAPVQEGGDGGDADQPPLGVDPLEGCHGEESSGCARGPFGMSRGRDPPGHPAEHRRPAPLQDLEGQRMSKEHVAQSQGDREQHRAHPGHLPQQAREALPDTGPCTDGGQQRIAGAGGSGNNR
jgi:hypothetical protein